MQRDQRAERNAGSALGGRLLEVGTGDIAATGSGKQYVNGSANRDRYAEVDRMLREGYGSGAAKTKVIDSVLEQYPQLTRPMVWKRAQRLQLVSSPECFRKWNPAEVRLLLGLINEVPVQTIAARLQRPVKSVLSKIRSLDMSARIGVGLSIRQASSDLQVSHHTVQGLIRRGELTVEGGRISDKSYRKYCQDLHASVLREAVPEDVVCALLMARDSGADYRSIQGAATGHLISTAGLSLREVHGLFVSEVDWVDSRCARVQVSRGKSGPERLVIVSGAAAEALREYRARRPRQTSGSRLLVDETGQEMDPQALEASLSALGRSGGFAVRVSSRGLRHAFAFRFLRRHCREGSNDAFAVLPKLTDLMGHYSPETVLMYVGVLHQKTGGRQKRADAQGETDS